MHVGSIPTALARAAGSYCGRVRLAAALLLVALVPTNGRADEGADFFEKKVRPVLAEHCYSCHAVSTKKAKGGLELDTPTGIRKGGESGPLVKAKDENSLLLKVVAHAPDFPAMPPKGKIPDTAVADLQRWVKMGAPLPAATANPSAGTPAREFWSFKPVTEQPAPKVSDPKWPAQKADFFILKKLDEQKLTPAPLADRRTLVRRIYFDLIGLPPTIEQVEAFVSDTRADAYERLVDELLASPRFGEKWARHWFDVARYAEDNSTGESTCRPPRFPYRYRDWVIGAFNADVPFDRFIRLQLAADLLPDTPPADFAALGFLGLSPVYHKEPKLSKDVISAFVADEWDERVDVITRGFLGLTVACARCHDHKFDPITAEDYYALAGVMANTQLAERPLKPDASASQDALTTVRLDLLDANMRLDYAKEMRGTAVKEKKDPTPFDLQIKKFEARVADLKKKEKGLDTGTIANVVRDAGTWVNGDNPDWTVIDYQPGKYRDLPVFIRGNPARPGAIVARRFPTVLSPSQPRSFREGSGRKELADAIVSDATGLTARVFVNRTWGWVFGRPIVTTPSNFGALGDRPTHPELLDDLAARFVANRWSMKWLVRELVTSAAYRQSTRHDEKFAAADPDNRWLWRAPRKRLELEAWRDATLQVSGQLNLAGGGPSDNLDSPRSVRRTVYGKVSRGERPADIHRLFDLPDPKAHGEKREATTTPVQQLYFLNSPFVRQSAVALAKATTAGKTTEDGVRALFQRVLLRDPTSDELETAARLVRPAREGAPPAWELLAQTLLASNEFLFLN
ncbi:PSD1 domain-containing protein [Gemmata sp. G18]|uniref:PSD1 domain-containing protein n=1 Tax=Gemmata palustris TaxID=2822762 RepID=A0ABS5BNZ5_9BACT|nr:PSD1 and planctomycete cytochrome C domain-containing protein [Gemmata palustris]MBP3954583.1 PSD1 domain-containing protein [Gemmata palustris]